MTVLAHKRKVNKLHRIIRDLLVICERAGHTGEPPDWSSKCKYCDTVREAKKEVVRF